MSDLLTTEVLAEIQRLRGHDPDIAGLLRHVAAMQAELDGSRAAVGCVNDMLTVLNERATRLREEAVEAFRLRAVAAVRRGPIRYATEEARGHSMWELDQDERNACADFIQQLPATEQPKEPHHARDDR